MSRLCQAVSIVAVILLGVSYYLYSALTDCRKVPDFVPSLSHVKKFTGYTKSFRFYVECTGKKVFGDCDIRTPEDVTGKTVILRMFHDGGVGTKSYVVDWVEEVNYYLDLSNPERWDINVENKKVVFHAPEVQFYRILRNDAYLPYVKDRKWLSDDENYLLKLTMRTHEVSESKSREYLKVHRAAINDEMEKSVKGFIRDILTKLKYPQGFDIEVAFPEEAHS